MSKVVGAMLAVVLSAQTSWAAEQSSATARPGGYWALGESPAPAPPDGENLWLTGSILVPVGTVAVASGAALAYFTDPRRCPAALPGLGLSKQDCRSLSVLNWVRTGYGGLMLVSGLVLLGIGLSQKRTHDRWKKQQGVMSSWGAMLDRNFVGVSFSLHF